MNKDSHKSVEITINYESIHDNDLPVERENICGESTVIAKSTIQDIYNKLYTVLNYGSTGDTIRVVGEIKNELKLILELASNRCADIY